VPAAAGWLEEPDRRAREPLDVSEAVDLEHRISLLEGVWLFSACNDDEIERIAAMAEPRSVDAGTEVTREGEPGVEFFVIVEGDAIATVDGDEVGRIAAGGFFGEMALIDGGERVATVTAVNPMKMLVLGRHEFNEMLEIAMPSVAPKLLAVVGERMRALEQHAGTNSTLGL
jgi:CRP-like cAMP-binding protein